MTKVIRVKGFMFPFVVKDDYCAYCKRKFKHGDIIVTLNSEDYFHQECYEEMMKNENL